MSSSQCLQCYVMTTRFKIRLELYPYLAALVVLYLLSFILRVIYTNCLLLSCYRSVDHLMPLITHLLKVSVSISLETNIPCILQPHDGDSPQLLGVCFICSTTRAIHRLMAKVNGDERNSNPQKVLAPNE